MSGLLPGAALRLLMSLEETATHARLIEEMAAADGLMGDPAVWHRLSEADRLTDVLRQRLTTAAGPLASS